MTSRLALGFSIVLSVLAGSDIGFALEHFVSFFAGTPCEGAGSTLAMSSSVLEGRDIEADTDFLIVSRAGCTCPGRSTAASGTAILSSRPALGSEIASVRKRGLVVGFGITSVRKSIRCRFSGLSEAHSAFSLS